LDKGYTTGTCATACTRAGLLDLLTDREPNSVQLDLPAGETATIDVNRVDESRRSVTFETRKDAGDDPDVTDGALVRTTVSVNDREGVTFEGGSGVGTVRRPGLPVAEGEPAINPVPRQMMRGVVEQFRERNRLTGGITLTVDVENGRELAQSTLNPRLGIEEGLSILGTTGIVEPYSHASYIASIEQGIDVAKANGLDEIVLSTGGRTEKNAQGGTDLPDYGYVQFAGYLRETLLYLVEYDFSLVQFYFMPGKFSKFAQGHLSLHSRDSEVDLEQLRETIRAVGGDPSGTESLASVNQIFSELPEAVRRDVVRAWIRRIPPLLRDEFGTIPWDFSITVLDLEETVLGREGFLS
jgi:cobalt-precorrin-5B (C1)-methyltransferase